MSAEGINAKDPRVRIAGAVAALVVLGVGLYVLRGVLSPIFFSLGIAYLLDPVVDRFERVGVPRAAAIFVVLTLLAAIGALFLLLVLPGVVREVVQFASDLPAQLSRLEQDLEPWFAEHGIPIPHTLDEALAELAMPPTELASHAAAPAQAVLGWVLGGTVSVVGAFASALVIPVLVFYLLYDFDRMVAGARDLVPARFRPIVVEVASEIDAVLGQFLRGQLLVMIAMGCLYAVAYSLVGVRLAIPIALVAGILAFIPYVGSGSALTMALLMCVVDWDGWTKPVLVLVAYAVCQFLEGFVIVPRVVGDKVGLPAVWVLVALMIGGEVFGFLGVLLAVPVAAIAKIFVMRGMTIYRKSEMYLGRGAKREGEGEGEGEPLVVGTPVFLTPAPIVAGAVAAVVAPPPAVTPPEPISPPSAPDPEAEASDDEEDEDDEDDDE
jgi:predicted PurR-regulated permease PerM